MDRNGNAVVAWQVSSGSDWNIQARRVSSSGTLGSVLNLPVTAARETAPSVALDPSNGKFVVAYQADTSSTKSVKVTEVSARNSIVRTSTFGTGVTDVSASVNANHSYLVVVSSIGRTSLDPEGGIVRKLGQL